MNEKVEMNAKVARLTCAVLATVGLIGLSACGGGGGSSKNMQLTEKNMQLTEKNMQLTEANLYGVGANETYKKLAANSPNFGSITQSSNGDNDISTDKVETYLEDGKLTVRVKDENDDVYLELDSRADLEANLNGTEWMDGDEIAANWDGWSGNGWVLAKQDGDDVVVSLAYVAWKDDDVTNYLAGGYWIKGNEAEGVTEMGTFGDAGPGSIFSYYDDLNSSWMRPTSGTATYRGEAEGAYVGPDGDGGVWWSMLMLNADFSTSSISGCAGCSAADPSGYERGIYTYSTIEDLIDDNWIEEGLYIGLESGIIGNDGSFVGTLKVRDFETDQALNSQGKWGGLFSENSNPASSPEQVIGTLGGTAETNTGEYGFVGVFLGQQ